jgi:HNH endonuclease
MEDQMTYTPEQEARFWSKVDKTGECWTWTAAISSVGYGAFWHSKQMQKSHRVAYELANGPIGRGMHIDHICHNRRCVKPSHLREVTPKQNVENHAGKAQVTSKSGIRGVVWVKDCNKWGVYVSHNGKSRYYGVYESIADAEAVAIKTRNDLFSHNDRDRQAA